MEELLLKRGSDPNKANKGGWTPIHCAASKGYNAVVQVLIKGGAQQKKTSITGHTPLSMA